MFWGRAFKALNARMTSRKTPTYSIKERGSIVATPEGMPPIKLSQTIQAVKPEKRPLEWWKVFYSVPDKPPTNPFNPLAVLKAVAESGLEAWKTTSQIKYGTPTSPGQTISRDLFFVPQSTIQDREIHHYQPQSQLPTIDINTGLPLIYGALESVSQAPRLVERAEQITAKTEKTGWLIAGAIAFLSLVLVSKRR